jgi:hypothetical protein
MSHEREREKLLHAIKHFDLDGVQDILHENKDIDLTNGRLVVKSLDEETGFLDLFSFPTLEKWKHLHEAHERYSDCQKITDLLLQRMIEQLWTHREAHLVSKRKGLPASMANLFSGYLDTPQLPRNVKDKLAEVRGNDALHIWKQRLAFWTVHEVLRGGRKRTQRMHSKKDGKTKRRKPKRIV